MPKEITHWMLAERALASLHEKGSVARILSRHRDAYLGGAVLPDTLAHIFRGRFHPTARLLGERFHDPSGSSYAPLIAAELQYEGIELPEPLLACLLGVLSHIEADVALHPWVFAATGKTGIGEHYRMETSIDVHFIQKGAAPAERRLERLLSPTAREAMLTAAGLLFDPDGELPSRALEEALALHCRFQAMYNQTLWKLSVRLLGRVAGSPFREQRHLFYPLRRWKKAAAVSRNVGEWRHPQTGELRSESLEELAQRAVEKTAELFQRVEAAGSLAGALAGRTGPNLLTGL
jgi:hypothetical protein